MVAAPPPDLGVAVPLKRKKGRPPKNRALVPLGENSTAPQNLDGRGRKAKRKKGEVAWPTVDSSFVGQQVHGVLDGSFDAGYLLTVRVANTQTVLRGAVFEPSLSVPISKSNDIAPNVRFIRRDEQVAPLQYPVENTSTAMLSPVAVPPVYVRNVIAAQSAPMPMEEDQRPPSETAMTVAAHVWSAVTPDDHKDMAPPLHLSDYGAEQKMDLQTDAQLQTV